MSYPSRVELTARGIRDAPELYARATWLDAHAVAERVLWESYLEADRVIPGGVPERAVTFIEWRHRVAVPRNVLDMPRRMWWRGKWKKWQRRVRNLVFAFVRSVADKMEMLEGTPVADEYQFDLWIIRHLEEAQYVLEIAQFSGLIQVWMEIGVTEDVHADAVILRDRQLPVNYRMARKAEFPLCAVKVRYERLCRSEYGYLIHWHNIEPEELAWNGLSGRYVPLLR